MPPAPLRPAVRYTFHLEGSAYSGHKGDFKALLKRHGLRWRGTFEEPWWGSAEEKVEASFDRDQTRDVTLAATLRWTGARETPFLQALRAWVLSLGGHAERERRGAEAAKPQVDRELEFWDLLNKPDERYMRAEGRPRRWIELDLEQWRRRRREKMRELGALRGRRGPSGPPGDRSTRSSNPAAGRRGGR